MTMRRLLHEERTTSPRTNQAQGIPRVWKGFWSPQRHHRRHHQQDLIKISIRAGTVSFSKLWLSVCAPFGLSSNHQIRPGVHSFVGSSQALTHSRPNTLPGNPPYSSLYRSDRRHDAKSKQGDGGKQHGSLGGQPMIIRDAKYARLLLI